jgi:hypothetical protein
MRLALFSLAFGVVGTICLILLRAGAAIGKLLVAEPGS